MYLNINIDLDNATFGDNPAEEVGRILENYAKNLKESSELAENFRDYNGNHVGKSQIVTELTEEKPRILLTIKSGFVQAIHSDTEIEAVVIDLDCKNTIENLNGKRMAGELFKIESEVYPKLVNHYFKQV